MTYKNRPKVAPRLLKTSTSSSSWIIVALVPVLKVVGRPKFGSWSSWPYYWKAGKNFSESVFPGRSESDTLTDRSVRSTLPYIMALLLRPFFQKRQGSAVQWKNYQENFEFHGPDADQEFVLILDRRGPWGPLTWRSLDPCSQVLSFKNLEFSKKAVTKCCLNIKFARNQYRIFCQEGSTFL